MGRPRWQCLSGVASAVVLVACAAWFAVVGFREKQSQLHVEQAVAEATKAYESELKQVHARLQMAEAELGRLSGKPVEQVHQVHIGAKTAPQGALDDDATPRFLQDFVEAPYAGAECLEWSEQDWGPWRLTDVSLTHCEQPTLDCIQSIGFPSGYNDFSFCQIEFAPSVTGAGLILFPEYFYLENGWDFLHVDGVEYTGTSIFKAFAPTENTTIEFTSDYCCDEPGFRFCMRASCSNYTCPDGYELSTQADFLACGNLTCSEDDYTTCCVSLASTACYAPDEPSLGPSMVVPDGCEEGSLYTLASGDCEISCAGDYQMNGFGGLQTCNEFTQSFTAPDCQAVVPDAGGSFQWSLTPGSACYEYGPGCIASNGLQNSGYGTSEACTAYPTSDHWLLVNYRMSVTYLSTEEQYDKLELFDYYSFPYFPYYTYSVIFAGTNEFTQGPYQIGRVEWTADQSLSSQGWLVCVQAKCLTMTCPYGYIFDCTKMDQYCLGTCETWTDVETCCKNETQEELGGFIEPGQGRNATSALCFTTTTTTPHNYQPPDWTAEMRLLAGANATYSIMDAAIRAALVTLGNVSTFDVWVWLVGPNFENTYQVGWITEQTEVDMSALSDELFLEAINAYDDSGGRRLAGGLDIAQAIQSRTISQLPAEERQTVDGYHAFPGYCEDLHPCDEIAGCWRDTTTTQKTCGQMHHEHFCANPPDLYTGGPGYDQWAIDFDWLGSFFDWVWYDSYDPAFSYPNYVNQVCCTCGGGRCGKGSYRMTESFSAVNNLFCAPCPRGTAGDGNGYYCDECPPGKFSGADASEICEDCEKGFYTDEGAMSQCLQCEPGWISAERGSSECEICPEGQYSSPNQDTCLECPQGRFAAENGTSLCEACPPGQAIPTRGQTACEACGVGTYATPVAGPDGIDIGRPSCDLCRPGRYAANTEQSACDECQPGSVQGLPGQTECEDCELGYFQSRADSTECELCPGGQEVLYTGAFECDRCERGSYKPDGEVNCTFCEPGRFSPSEGQPDCDKCAVGSATADWGRVSCDRCAPGRYADFEQFTECLACDPGQFQSEEESASCTLCLKGEFTNASGLSVCSICEPGYYTSAEGLAFCTACEPGEEAPLAGSIDCETCRVGFISVTAGTPECSACPKGRFSNVEGFTACLICEPGWYAAVEGLSWCEQCEYASYAEDFGMTGCDGCNETKPGEAASWTTWKPPTDEERANGRKAWHELRGADNRTACGCRAEWQPVGDICEKCGEGLICLGNGELDIEEFYAWDFGYSVWDCRNGIKEACPGGEPGACMPGRNEEAIACAECLEGMVANTDGSCSKCEDKDYMVPTLVLLCGLICAIIAYCVFDSPKRKRPKLSFILIVASLGQFVTIIQQLGIISLIRVTWTGPLLGVFQFISSVTFFDVQVLRPSCVMVMDIVRLYALRVGMVFICLIIIVLAHFASQLIQHRHDWRTRFPSLACAVGTILLTFFVSILSTMLGPLQCKTHPNDRQTISWYPSVTCWEGGKHNTMLIIGVCACILPLLFLVACLWAVRTFPRKLLKATTRFLNAWAFLFFRYTTKAYWYGPIVLVRNGLISAGPVLVSPIAQILLLETTMLFSLCLLLRVMPWRVKKANYLDATGHLCLLMLTMMASFFVEEERSTHFVSIIGVIFIGIIPVVLILCILYGSVMLIRSMRRPFQFFLCHHKLGAGCFCRLLKMRLLKSKGVERKVFIDSDDLKNLDKLFDCVAHDTETLVAICSQSLLLRPWCVGELTTAFRNKVNIQPVYVSGVDVLSDDFIDNFLLYLQDISALTQYGIDLPMIQEAFRYIQGLPSIFLPQELHDDTIHTLCHKLVNRPQRNETIDYHTAKAAEGSQVIIIADKADFEATATSFILRDLINPVIQHKENSIASVLPLGCTIPQSIKKGLLVCTNGVFTPHVINALVDCLSCSASVFPVMSVTNFTFPSEAWMSQQKQFQQLDEQKRAKATSVVQAIFTEIAVDFQPSALSGTEATLTIKAEEIAARMYGVAAISEKVGRLSEKKQTMRSSNSTPVVHKASTDAQITGIRSTDADEPPFPASETNGDSSSQNGDNNNGNGIEVAVLPVTNFQSNRPPEPETMRKTNQYMQHATIGVIRWEQDVDEDFDPESFSYMMRV